MKKTFSFLALGLLILSGCAENLTPQTPAQTPPPAQNEAPAQNPPPAKPAFQTMMTGEYSFQYPLNVSVIAADEANAVGQKIALESYAPGTNLKQAAVKVLKYQSSACPKDFGMSLGALQKVNLNGTSFDFEKFEDHGAGSVGEVQLYSTTHAVHCYELSLSLFYSPVPGAHENPPPAFDRAKLEKTFTEIAQSFKFL